MNYQDLSPSDFELIPLDRKISARVLELNLKVDYKVFIFSEERGVYSCLFPVSSILDKLPKINGLVIKYEVFSREGEESKSYILIECRSKEYAVNFTIIIKEIIERFDNGVNELTWIINKVISKWRHFFGQSQLQILKEEEILGLLGELMFLHRLLELRGSDALYIWTPERGEEDFISESKTVEVKTTLKEKHEHLINGIDQLLVDSQREKHILSLLLCPSLSNGSLSLPVMINMCLDLLLEDIECLDFFFKKLRSRGYDVSYEANYLEFTYKCIRGGYFKIDSDFPKLTTNELIRPLNSRISKVRYTVDMEGLYFRDFFNTDLNQVI